MQKLSWKDELSKGNVEIKTIRNIKKIARKRVYNISVKDNHNYFCNGILTHNCDELCLIDSEVYRQKITRMLGDNQDSIILSIGNPWHRDNQMYEQWINPEFKQIHIDYNVGLAENRITEAFIEQQRNDLTEMEFTILYRAMFPKESEDQLIKLAWIELAEKRRMEIAQSKLLVGVDVADMGTDLTVMTKGCSDGTNYKVELIESWGKKDTMETVGKLIPHLQKGMTVKVDAVGVGAGVHARLKELGYKAIDVKVGRTPENPITMKKLGDTKFRNQKAEFYWKLRTLFEQGRIDIPKHHELRKQLVQIKYEIKNGKIEINDGKKEGLKSPDFSDSLCLFCSGGDRKLIFEFA